MVGGKNKYLINGTTAQLHAVETLFQSVQLNVNNPSFLIMQGKITKVLNMKPPEILAMIEEAAGTRMFEEKKDKALAAISKKDKKLDEIKSVSLYSAWDSVKPFQTIEEEITPKLNKFREEKRNMMELQKLTVELDRLKRYSAAYNYFKLKVVIHVYAYL